jgi:hypothetical protein
LTAETSRVRLKTSNISKFTFIPDGQGAAYLRKWVKSVKQITAGHLAQLADANGLILAMIDGRIPKGFSDPFKQVMSLERLARSLFSTTVVPKLATEQSTQDKMSFIEVMY